MSIKTLLLYHDKDKEYADGMQGHLIQDIRQKVLEIQPNLLPGEPLENRLKLIRESKLILYLISMDAYRDEDLGVTYLNESIELAKKGEAILVPIYVRSFFWQDTDLRHFFVEKKPIPISGYDPIDDGCLEVVSRLKKMFVNFDKLLGTQKLTLEQQRNLLKSFNYHEQINENTKKQVQDAAGWCKVCLLQGDEKSGFNVLGWRIRTELAGIRNNEPTTCRNINLNDLGDTQGDDAEAYKTLFCQEMLAAPSVAELAKQLRQHLQTQHFVLYVQNLTPINIQFVAAFIAELKAAWSASNGDPATPEPAFSFWCYLTYTGETPLDVSNASEIQRLQFPTVKKVAASEFGVWLDCCTLEQTKKVELLNAKDYIVEQEPEQNQVALVLERLCEKLTFSTLMYEEFVSKIDNGLTL